MFRQKCAVLGVLAMAAVFVLTSLVFAVDKASKDAILEELGKVADKNPEILRGVIFSMADGYVRDNKIDEAISVFEKGLKVLPGNEDFLSRLGDLYNQKGDFGKVAEIYKKLSEARPDSIWYFQRLSEAYRNAGENAKAGQVWEDLLKKTDNAEVFIQAANYYSSVDNMDGAISTAKKATELAPDNASYLQSLEAYYVRAEKFDEAEAICNKVLKGAKEAWMKDWANSELINIYQGQDKLGELAARFEKELAAAPKEIGQYRKIAELYLRTNDRDKAIEVYEKAVSAGVADRDTNFRLLDLYEWSEKFDKAEAQIKKAMEMAPADTYLYERRANLLARAGKKDEAKKAWAEFLAKVPNDAGAVTRYGDKLNEWGDVDGAIAQYRKAQGMDPTNLWYTMRVADILAANGKKDEAKKELKNIISKTSDEWMKKDAERRLSDIEARAEATAPVSVAAPVAATPVVEEKMIAPEPAKAKEEPKKEEATKKKKRGWGIFSR